MVNLRFKTKFSTYYTPSWTDQQVVNHIYIQVDKKDLKNLSILGKRIRDKVNVVDNYEGNLPGIIITPPDDFKSDSKEKTITTKKQLLKKIDDTIKQLSKESKKILNGKKPNKKQLLKIDDTIKQLSRVAKKTRLLKEPAKTQLIKEIANTINRLSKEATEEKTQSFEEAVAIKTQSLKEVKEEKTREQKNNDTITRLAREAEKILTTESKNLKLNMFFDKDVIAEINNAFTEKKHNLSVRNSEPVKTEYGGSDSLFNCGIKFLANVDPKILSKLTDDERKYVSGKSDIDLITLLAIAERLDIGINLITPQGTKLISNVTKNKLTIYGIVNNHHIYKVSNKVYTKIKNKSIRYSDITSEIEFVDCRSLNEQVINLYKEKNYVPLYVNTDGENIISYIDDNKCKIAIENHEVFAKLIKRLIDCGVFNPNDKLIPSASCIADKLVDLWHLPKEQIAKHGIFKLYKDFNLEAPYWMKENSDKCFKDAKSYDITACYWNILKSFKSLPIMSPFDRVVTKEDKDFNIQAAKNDEHSFCLLENHEFMYFDYNHQLMHKSLVDELNAWDFVYAYVIPHGVLKSNPFNTMQDIFDQINDEDLIKPIKIVRNAMNGILGQMQYNTSYKYLSVDDDLIGYQNNLTILFTDKAHRLVLNQEHVGVRFKEHNRSVYNMVVSTGHIHLLRLMKEVLKQNPNHEVYKIKVDSVTLIPCESPIYNLNSIGQIYNLQGDKLFDYHSEVYNHKPFINSYKRENKYVSPEIQSIDSDKYLKGMHDFRRNWLCLNASARLGKTYFINHFGLDDKTTLYATPTRASLQLMDKPNKETIQSICAYKINIKKSIKTLIIDEVSMADIDELSKIMMYCEDNNIRLIISGDYQQLPAVNKGQNCSMSDWFKFKFVFITFKWHSDCGLTKDKYELMEKLRNNQITVDELKAKGSTKESGDTEINLAYFNKTVDAYNAKVKNPFIYITTKKTKDYVNGLKLFKVKGNKKVYYTDWEGKKITYTVDGKERQIPKDHMKLCHSSTVHVYQGSSVDNKIHTHIHLQIDCERMTKEMLYVAITRTPGFKYTLINTEKASTNNKGVLRSHYRKHIYKLRYVVYGYRNEITDYYLDTIKRMPTDEEFEELKKYDPDETMYFYCGIDYKYIGMTNNPTLRAEQHQEAKGYNLDDMVIISRCYTEFEAKLLERQLIEKHNPKDNKQLKPKAIQKKIKPTVGEIEDKEVELPIRIKKRNGNTVLTYILQGTKKEMVANERSIEDCNEEIISMLYGIKLNYLS